MRYPNAVDRASLAYRHLVPAGLRRGAIVCAVTHAMGDEIRETYNLPPDRVHVTPLGVDREWFLVDPTEPPPPGIPTEYVLAVGTLEPRKNLGTLLEAYRLAAQRGSDLPPLVLVGAQGWGAALDISGIPADRVVLTGRLSDRALRRVVSGASAFSRSRSLYGRVWSPAAGSAGVRGSRACRGSCRHARDAGRGGGVRGPQLR